MFHSTGCLGETSCGEKRLEERKQIAVIINFDTSVYEVFPTTPRVMRLSHEVLVTSLCVHR